MEITTDLLGFLGIQWKDDNPKKKPHYEGNILVYVGGHEFSNSTTDGSFVSWGTGISFKNLEQLKIVWMVLNNWKELDTSVVPHNSSEGGGA